MKKLFCVLIICVSLFFFKDTLFHQKLPIPADTIIGLYHPFRDFYAREYPNGIPFKNFLITDPVRQLYPWRELIIAGERNLELPLWNPYSFAGTPLLANFQSAAFYPLNILFFLLPFSFAWSIQVMLQMLLVSIFLFLYLTYLKINPIAALFASIAYALSGFSIAWLEWNTIGHVMLWLPLILLAIEKILLKVSWKWLAILLFAGCAQIFAGHLQVLFYSLLVSNVYLFFRIWQLSKNNKQKSLIYTYLSFLGIGVSVFLITSIQLLPTIQFILYSARDVDQSIWQKEGWFIPWHHLVQFIIPDFFGNPATLNYFGTWNYGELIGYIGIIPLIMSLYALLFRRDALTKFFGLLLFVSFLFALPNPIAQIPFLLQIPFLSSTQPTRLISIIDLSLVILTALGMDLYIKKKKNIFVSLIIIAVCFVTVWIILLFNNIFHLISVENLAIAKRNSIFPTIIFFLSVAGLLAPNFLKWKKTLAICLCFLFVVLVLDLLRFGQKFTPFVTDQYLYPTTKVVSFLSQNIENNRIMTTDSRILPPNFSSIYRIASIDGYDPLYLRSYGEFVAALERKKPDISAPFGFNRIITPHNYDSRFIDLLGVKYVVSLSDIQHPKLIKVLQEGQTHVYENKQVFARTFFVEEVFSEKDISKVIELLFTSDFDLKKQAVVQANDQRAIKYSVGSAEITQYNENKVSIKTNNIGEGFLVLTDIFYPTWHAFVDGKETPIQKTNFTFRGIAVPQGRHEVTFIPSLF